MIKISSNNQKHLITTNIRYLKEAMRLLSEEKTFAYSALESPSVEIEMFLILIIEYIPSCLNFTLLD